MRTLTLAASLTMALAGSALAQSPNTQGTSQQGQNQQPQSQQTQNQQSQRPISQQIINDLQGAGYTDVRVMPESFLVRAKDRDGNPVMMVINPDSITAITEIGSGRESPQTTGSGAQGNPSAGPANKADSR